MADLPKIDESYLDSQLQQSDHIRSVVRSAETIKTIVTFIAVALVLAVAVFAAFI